MKIIKEDIVDINKQLFLRKIQNVKDKFVSNSNLQSKIEEEVKNLLRLAQDILNQFSLKSLKTIPRCLLDFCESTSAIERIYLCLPFKFTNNNIKEDEQSTMNASLPYVDKILDILYQYKDSFKELYKVANTAPLPRYVIDIFSYEAYNCEHMIDKFIEFKKYILYNKQKEVRKI